MAAMELRLGGLQEEQLERFAEEFCKHEELMKPRLSYAVQAVQARRQALQALGEVFGVPDMREMARLLARFRHLCVNKMRWLIRVAQARYGTGADALHIAPAWLRKLDVPFNLMITALKMESVHEGPRSPHSMRMARFTWELYCGVLAALQESDEPAALVTDSSTVAAFAHKMELPQDTVHGIWTRMYEAALAKLRFSSRLGDVKNPSRPSSLDWHVIDLALLYDPGQAALATESLSNSLEVEAMLQLYKLITEADNKLDKHKQENQNNTEKTPNTTKNTQNVSEVAPNETEVTQSATETTKNVTETTQNVTETTQNTAGTPQNASERIQSEQSNTPQTEYQNESGTQIESSATSSKTQAGSRPPAASGAGPLKSRAEAVPEWESAELWAMVHSEYNKRGRVASLVTLQKRWHELKLLARDGMLRCLRDQSQKPHPLLLAIVKRFPHVVTSPLAPWARLARERRVHGHDAVADASIQATLADVPSCVSMSDVMTDLLEWSDDEPEIIEAEKEVIDLDSDNEADTDADKAKQEQRKPALRTIKTEKPDDSHTNPPQPNTNTTHHTAITQQADNPSANTPHVVKSDQLNNNGKLTSENTSILNVSMQTLIDNSCLAKLRSMPEVKRQQIDGTIKENTTTADVEATTETNTRKAKSRIIFEDDDDLDEIDNFFANFNTDHELNDEIMNDNDNVTAQSDKPSPLQYKSNSYSHNNSRKGNSRVKSEPDESDTDSHMNEHTSGPTSNNKEERLNRLTLKRKLVDNYYKKVPRDCFKDVVAETGAGDSDASVSREGDSDSDSEEATVGNYIDEKLLELSRVILTPLEHIWEWQRHARGNTLNCRYFSVRRLAAAVTVTARQLNACRRYVPPASASGTGVARASGTGVAREKCDEFRDMPRAYKVMKKKLCHRLRLSRTFLAPGFWTSARNVAQLCVCDPLTVTLERLPPRVVKKVELPDIAEVRRINSTLLTAQVAPISVETSTDGDTSPVSDAAHEATSSAPRAEEREGAEEEAALPSREDLMKMIKSLVHPSMQALREADASLRRQRQRHGAAADEWEEAMLQSQRNKCQQLNKDIISLIGAHNDTPPKRRPAPQSKKASQKKSKQTHEEEQPLPDAYQEWQRQKTLVHKYFNFNTPAGKQPTSNPPRTKARAAHTAPRVNDPTEPNNIGLMSVSDDDDSTDGNRTNDHTKRPLASDDSDSSNKRAKPTEDHPNETARSNEENADSDDDADRMIIDEGIHDIDEPASSDPLSAPDLRLTIMPVSSVGGLRADHDASSNVVYVVKTHKKVNVPKNADVVPTSSTVSSIKLPDASLTRNPPRPPPRNPPGNPPVTCINTALPTYYFIQSGQPVHGNPQFKVHSGPPLRSIVPKYIPISDLPRSVIDGSESAPTCAAPTYPTNVIRMRRPGPLSSKSSSNATGVATSKASGPKKSSLDRANEQTPRREIVEIDLTSDTEEDGTAGNVAPKLISVTSMSEIRKGNDVANPSTDVDGKDDVNTPGDTVGSTTSAVVRARQLLTLEVGPIKTTANTRTYSKKRTLPGTPEVDASRNDSSVNFTFFLKNDPPWLKHKDAAETRRPDSEARDGHEAGSLRTSIKREKDLDIDASSGDSESADVDVETLPGVAVKTESPSPTKPAPARATDKIALTTTSPNQNTRTSSLKTTQKGDTGRIVIQTTSQNPDTVKSLLKTLSQKEDSSRSVLKGPAPTARPAPTPPQDTDNIPIKITSTMTSKDLLKLSPEELARLLENDDDFEEVVEYAHAPHGKVDTTQHKVDTTQHKVDTTQHKVDTTQHKVDKTQQRVDKTQQRVEKAQQKVVISHHIAPIQIKKEKVWEEEIERSKGRDLQRISVEGVEVKKEPGGSGVESEKDLATNLDLLLQGVPTLSELKNSMDVICGDEVPVADEEGEGPMFQSIADLGRCAIDVREYVDKITDPEEPILKLDFSEPLWVLAQKYLLLTDENIQYATPSYVTSVRTSDVAPYTQIRFPDDVRNKQTLDLGTKKGRDVMVCGCGGKGQCMLCQSIAGEDGKAPEFEIYKPKFNKLCRACGLDPKRERARIFTIKQRPYRKIGDTPLKFVVVDVRKRCRVCKDGAQFVANPDTLVINDKHYEKMRDEPLMYAPVLSVVQGPARCARLARREAELYLHNLRTAHRRRVLYRADAQFAAFNAAVKTAMSKMDREEVDAWYRRKVDKD